MLFQGPVNVLDLWKKHHSSKIYPRKIVKTGNIGTEDTYIHGNLLCLIDMRFVKRGVVGILLWECFIVFNAK